MGSGNGGHVSFYSIWAEVWHQIQSREEPYLVEGGEDCPSNSKEELELGISLARGSGFDPGKEGSQFRAAVSIRWNAERILE